jgi:hypothetical protein
MIHEQGQRWPRPEVHGSWRLALDAAQDNGDTVRNIEDVRREIEAEEQVNPNTLREETR